MLKSYIAAIYAGDRHWVNTSPVCGKIVGGEDIASDTMSQPADERGQRELIDDLLAGVEHKARGLNLTNEEVEEILRDSYVVDRDQWTDLQPTLKQAEKERNRSRARHHLEQVAAERLISKWVEQHVAAQGYQKDALTREIARSLQDGQTEQLREYLSDVLGVGLDEADKRRKGNGDDRHRYLGYAWVTLVGLLRIAIVVAIFMAAQTKFETIVFAMLVLIYYAICASSSANAGLIEAFRPGLHAEFKRLRRLLKEELTDDARATEYEVEKDLLKGH